MMKQQLSIKPEQQTRLSVVRQLSLRILQLSGDELNEEIERQLAENPFLEKIDEEEWVTEQAPLEQYSSEVQNLAEKALDFSHKTPIRGQEGLLSSGIDDFYPEDISACGYAGDGEGGIEVFSDPNSYHLDTSFLDSIAAKPRVVDELIAQIYASHTDELGKLSLLIVVESLGADGYLRESKCQLANLLFQELDLLQGDDAIAVTEIEVLAQIEKAIARVRQMEPAGVGAFDLADCLKLQIERKLACAKVLQQPSWRLLLEICQRDVALLVGAKVAQLAKSWGVKTEEIQEALTLVHELDPKPLHALSLPINTVFQPDLWVIYDGGDTSEKGAQKFKVKINPAVQPKIRVRCVNELLQVPLLAENFKEKKHIWIKSIWIKGNWVTQIWKKSGNKRVSCYRVLHSAFRRF